MSLQSRNYFPFGVSLHVLDWHLLVSRARFASPVTSFRLITALPHSDLIAHSTWKHLYGCAGLFRLMPLCRTAEYHCYYSMPPFAELKRNPGWQIYLCQERGWLSIATRWIPRKCLIFEKRSYNANLHVGIIKGYLHISKNVWSGKLISQKIGSPKAWRSATQMYPCLVDKKGWGSI